MDVRRREEKKDRRKEERQSGVHKQTSNCKKSLSDVHTAIFKMDNQMKK